MNGRRHIILAAGVIRDNVRGETVTYETIPTKPILVTADGVAVIVANDADNRFVVLNPALTQQLAEVTLGQGLCAIAERVISGAPSEIWVTLRLQGAVIVIDSGTGMINHLSVR